MSRHECGIKRIHLLTYYFNSVLLIASSNVIDADDVYELS